MLFLVFFFFKKKRTLKRGFRMFFKEIIVWIDALTMVRGMDSWIGSYYEIALLSEGVWESGCGCFSKCFSLRKVCQQYFFIF
jgi:hypothetical protein